MIDELKLQIGNLLQVNDDLKSELERQDQINKILQKENSDLFN